MRLGLFDRNVGGGFGGQTLTPTFTLSKVHFEIFVTSFVSRREIVQEYENNLKKGKTAEVEYKFSVSSRSTTTEIEVELYDQETKKTRILRGQIEEKKKAQEKYEDSLAEGNAAALAERDEDNVVTLNLGLIKSGIRVTVRLQCVEELSLEQDLSFETQRVKVVIPSLNYSGSELIPDSINNVSVKCHFDLRPGTLISLTSPSHPTSFKTKPEHDGDHHYIISTLHPISLTKDIQVEASLQNLPPFSLLISPNPSPPFTTTPSPHKYTSMLISTPNLPSQSSSTELIIILDCSGSMTGQRIKFAKEAILSLLSTISSYYEKEEKDIKINIFRFGTKSDSAFPNSQSITHSNTLKTLKTYISTTGADFGGTDILKICTKVLEKEVTHACTRQIFFLTDGEDSNTENIIRVVRRRCDTTRFFTFGIGSGINPVLLSHMAEVSGGRSVFVRKAEDIEQSVLEQVGYALQPSFRVKEVKFWAEGQKRVKGREVSGERTAYNLRNSSMFYFCDEVPIGATVNYEMGGKELSAEVSKVIEGRDGAAGRLAARARVRELEDGEDSKKKKSEEEILRIGLWFGFMTSKTSFVMVEEKEEEGGEGEGEEEGEAFEETMEEVKIGAVQKEGGRGTARERLLGSNVRLRSGEGAIRRSLGILDEIDRRAEGTLSMLSAQRGRIQKLSRMRERGLEIGSVLGETEKLLEELDQETSLGSRSLMKAERHVKVNRKMMVMLVMMIVGMVLCLLLAVVFVGGWVK